MCGISAICNAQREPRQGAIERMIQSLEHRGPDATTRKHLPGCHLGHNRLSIIDLSGGDQPMQDASSRYWITYNGELYNFHELRTQLLHEGCVFRTQSDTEVVLGAYAQWGSACLDRFRGMFAFAIWDTHERILFAARDPFGEKPLYYAPTTDGGLVLGSELKALLASQLVKPELDVTAVDAFLALGYVPPQRTIYSNVQTLPPAHFLRWSAGRVEVDAYWAPRLAETPMEMADAAERLRELLQQAVQRQMVADVPVGAFLSGGLDSSSIVALMQMQSARPVMTFSVGFGTEINELPYARAVARKYGTEHHEVDLGAPAVGPLLERMVGVYDEPFADSSHIPTYLISEFASRHVKVVLSGDGGDEMFGGYAWYPALDVSRNVSGSLVEFAVLRVLSRVLRDRIRSLALRSVASGLSHRASDMWQRAIQMQLVFKPAERRALLPGSAVSAMPDDAQRPASSVHGLNRSFHFDITTYLPGDILVKVDRAAMAHGLETRAPMLDRDLAEFALSLPASLKVDRAQTKMVLHRACASLWPAELQGRAKQGFGVPYDSWQRRADVRALTGRVLADGSALRALLPGLTRAGVAPGSYRAWTLLTLGLWLERQGDVSATQANSTIAAERFTHAELSA